jgi:hypothetical protein
MKGELEGDTDNFPLYAKGYLETKYGKSINELIIENGYTWFQYTVKKNYYWK